MAYLRDRRAFGNIGTRKFRGARFGDPLSPRGPQYTLEGRVLDYSTDVGPFTIVDQSGEGNTATLYSGRGLTMDAVNDTVTYDTTYTSASRTATVWMRVTALGARTLNGATGTFTFTPTATNTWEELSSTATVSGDLAWTAGSDCDIGDLTCATEHWTHNDWSDPTGDTSNGKTIVDSGPNDYHGTCTGCSGFTGEATIPQTADKNWNKYSWFNGTNANVGLGAGDPLGFNGSAKIEWRGYIYVTGTAPLSASKNAFATFVNGGSAGFSVALNAANTLRVAGRSVSTDGFQNYAVAISNGLHYVKCYADFTNGEFGISIDEAAYTTQSATFANNTYTFGSSTNPTQIGAADSANGWDSILSTISILKDDVASSAYTGLGNDPWKDTIGTNDGTESGTFTRELVAASDANDQIDALGTAISEPRLNTQQLNLFGEGEYSRTPASASLDLTTAATWEIWGNFYGAASSGNRYVFSKYVGADNERSWAVLKRSDDTVDTSISMFFGSDSGVLLGQARWHALADSVQGVVITYTAGSLLLYLDGVLIGAPNTEITVPTSIYVGSAPVTNGSLDTGTAPYNGKIGSAKIYNVALTADEVLTNYNTQKSLYGL